MKYCTAHKEQKVLRHYALTDIEMNKSIENYGIHRINYSYGFVVRYT